MRTGRGHIFFEQRFEENRVITWSAQTLPRVAIHDVIRANKTIFNKDELLSTYVVGTNFAAAIEKSSDVAKCEFRRMYTVQIRSERFNTVILLCRLYNRYTLWTSLGTRGVYDGVGKRISQ